MDAHRMRQRIDGARGNSIITKLPNEQQLNMTWDAEQQRVIFQRAMQTLLAGGRINSRTLEVFEMVALKNVPAVAVADQFEIEVSEVYRIKNRVTKRLREIVDNLTQAYQTGM
jgi:DNA-directed RNA polymerase specialized sigma24 family protein